MRRKSRDKRKQDSKRELTIGCPLCDHEMRLSVALTVGEGGEQVGPNEVTMHVVVEEIHTHLQKRHRGILMGSRLDYYVTRDGDDELLEL